MTQLSARLEPVRVSLPTLPRPRPESVPTDDPTFPPAVPPSGLSGTVLARTAVPAPAEAVDGRLDTPAARPVRDASPWAPLASQAVATAATGAGLLVALEPRSGHVAVAGLAWLALLASAGHLRRPALGEHPGTAVARVLVTGVKALVLAAASLPLLDGVPHRGTLLWLAVAFTVSSAVVSLAAPARPARIVVVGPPREVRDVLGRLGSARRHEVVAVCLTRRSRTPIGDVPAYLGLDNTTAAVTRQRADAVVVLPGHHVSPVLLRRLQWEVDRTGASLYLGTGLLDVAPYRARMVSSYGLEVLHVAPTVLHGPRRLLKDAVERAAALLGLVVLLPLLAVLMVLVRRDSPGPALFRQERIGRDGKAFRMLKLRSMTVSAETDRTGLAGANEKDAVLFKIRQDPRVTDVGRWLRRYSLDELPQLWNVVRGDMSLVGPRPALPVEVAQYGVDPRRRLVVKPGVTGLWQVSGRSDLTWEESVRLDLRYVDNWSLSLDLAILVRTVRAVLGHRGAY